MADCDPRWSQARFGGFELDRTSGVLKKLGLRVKLQEQPFQILTLLLDRRGEIVTRDELRQKLWPDGTHVDFEHSLNAAVAKIRQALNDAAGTPRFIETMARRGYRLVGPVELVGPHTSAHPHTAPSPDGPTGLPTDAAAAEVSVSIPVHSRRPVTLWVVAAFLSLCASVVIGTWDRSASALKTGTVPVPLTSYTGSESMPAFSPDGSQVAFVWDGPEENNADIYVKVVGTGEPLRLTSDPARDDAPAWSPDGRWIAFVRRTAAHFQGDVYVVPALGGVERRVRETVFSGQYAGPTLAWTGDSKWLAVRDDGAPVPGLYLISLETGESRLLLERPAEDGIDRGAAFSPDGGQLAFTRSGRLHVVDLDGLKPKGRPRPLTREAGATIRSQAWNPDQKYIVFQRHTSAGTGALWRVRADGSEDPLPIPNTGHSAFVPAVSRGGRLVYAEVTYDANIWRLPLDGPGVSGGPPARLISSSRFDGSMALSADGRHVAFTSTRSGTEQIWVADSDGSRPTQLTNYHEGFAGSPRWSPDGSLIAYDTVLNDRFDICIVPAGGGSPTRMTNTGKNKLPTWSADGKFIYFSSERDGRFDVWKKPLSGGQEIRVTRNGGIGGRESPDGKFFSYFSAEDGRLWVLPLRDNVPDESQKHLVTDGASLLAFDISKTGIYYGVFVSFGAVGDRTDPPSRSLYFYDFATGVTRKITTLSKPLSIGLSASRDESFLLFSQLDRNGSDLMLMEGVQ